MNNKPSMVNGANRVRSIRTEKWKYNYYFDAMGTYANQYELYDLVNDPGEMINRAYDQGPVFKKIREDPEQQLKELEITKLLIHS